MDKSIVVTLVGCLLGVGLIALSIYYDVIGALFAAVLVWIVGWRRK